MRKKAITMAMLAFAVSFTGCMTNREFCLRQQDMENKKAWPATYCPVKIKGPLTLDKDSELIVTVPNQPYAPTSIPDGQAIQAKMVTDMVHTGAILGGAIYSIHKANTGGSKTIINNNVAGE